MALTKAQEAEVIATMEQYAAAYRKKDIQAFSLIFSKEITGFGSGQDEIIRNHAGLIRQIRRDMSQADILAVEFSDRQIFGDGRVAWVTSQTTMTFTLDGAKKQTLQGRSTMVLRNNGNRWIIEQLHFSLPFGGQAEGQSFPGV
jgi:ketosteroid isomerase-like protein